MSLSITVKYGEYFTLGDAKVTVSKGNGNQCTVNIVAPREIQIKRQKFDETKLTNVTTKSNVQIRRIIK